MGAQRCPECRKPVLDGENCVARRIETEIPDRGGRTRVQRVVWHAECWEASEAWIAKVRADAEQERQAMLAELKAAAG